MTTVYNIICTETNANSEIALWKMTAYVIDKTVFSRPRPTSRFSFRHTRDSSNCRASSSLFQLCCLFYRSRRSSTFSTISIQSNVPNHGGIWTQVTHSFYWHLKRSPGSRQKNESQRKLYHSSTFGKTPFFPRNHEISAPCGPYPRGFIYFQWLLVSFVSSWWGNVFENPFRKLRHPVSTQRSSSFAIRSLESMHPGIVCNAKCQERSAWSKTYFHPNNNNHILLKQLIHPAKFRGHCRTST